jgi:hypothetical protein
MASEPCFLRLPVELRLNIYSYAILDCTHITIGTAKLQGSHADIIHRQYGDKRVPYPGIPHQHEPIIEAHYQPDLLSPTEPATIDLSHGDIDPPAEFYTHLRTAYHTLSLLNKQINNELRTHFPIPTRRQSSLFLQYPHGLHILHTTTPQLLRQCKSVHLAGTYISRTYCAPRAARLGAHMLPAQEQLEGNIVPDSEKQLEDLIRSAFGPNPRHPLGKFEMRVYFPGTDSYSTVWGDDGSPVVIALRNIAIAEVGMEIWRGRRGTGVYFSAAPSPERRRVVSTVWRRLEEGRNDGPACGDWVVDPRWPHWDASCETSTVPKYDAIVTTNHHP